jgi:hypothetical protein
VSRNMDDFDAAGDGQYFSVSQTLVDSYRLQSLVGMKRTACT